MKKCREKTEKPASQNLTKLINVAQNLSFCQLLFFQTAYRSKTYDISFYRLWPIKCVTKHLFPNSKIITKSLQESCNHAVANRRGKNEKKS